MTDALSDLQDIRKKVEKANQEHIRREALADQAEGIEKDSLTKLEELGASTPEEADDLAAQLEEKISETVREINDKIKEATA